MLECRPLFPLIYELVCSILCFVDRASRYIHFMFCWPCISIYSFYVLLTVHLDIFILCFVDRASRYIHFKENQLDAQFIFSIVRQTPLHVSGVSTAHHQEVHRTDTTIGAYTSILFSWLSVVLAGFQPSQDNRHSSKKNIITNCCIRTVYLLMMGCRYARNV